MDDNKHHRRDDNRAPGPLVWSSAEEPAPMKDLMIDIETLGTKPGSAVLSIGAVMFGPAGLGEEFYAPISLESCIKVGLTIDAGTVAWWMQQSDAARTAAFRNDALPLPVALLRFTSWFDSVKAERAWCHGANFDAPLLEAAYNACSMTPPWNFWNVRDTRTLYDLADAKVDRSKGVHHNALDDARSQAEVAVRVLHDLRRRVKRGELSAEVKAAIKVVSATRATAGLLPDGSAVFINYGDQPEDKAHLDCTACGGSGHIDDQSSSARDVLAERRRQVETEGRTPASDDVWVCDELAAYAALYAMPPACRGWTADSTGYGETWAEAILPEGWTLPKFGDRRRELVKAGALILAEIERLDRAAAGDGAEHD